MTGEAEPLGVELLKEVVKQLVILNENMKENREVMLEMRDLLDEDMKVRKSLVEVTDALGWEFDVFSLSMEILAKNKRAGKLSLADFTEAYLMARDEMSEEEDDDDRDGEVESPDEDPVLPGGGRV